MGVFVTKKVPKYELMFTSAAVADVTNDACMFSLFIVNRPPLVHHRLHDVTMEMLMKSKNSFKLVLNQKIFYPIFSS